MGGGGALRPHLPRKRAPFSAKTPSLRCIFTAICALIAEIPCDVGHDASITAREMPRCGELSWCALPKNLLRQKIALKVIFIF